MIKPQLTHVGIYVKDMDKMLAFYSQVFGLTVTDAGRPPDFHLDIAFLSANPGEHHQVVLVGGREEGANANVAQQISFVVASLDEVREMRDRIVAAGMAVRRVVTHGNAWSLYFSDPEDNTLEIYAIRRGTYHSPPPFRLIWIFQTRRSWPRPRKFAAPGTASPWPARGRKPCAG